MKQVMELMKMRTYQIPSFVFNNYKKLKMTEKELIVLIYMYNSQVYFNPKAISNDLNMKIENVLEIVGSLEEKNIIKIDAIDKDNLRCEMINYDPLYEKCSFILADKKDDNDIYSKYEKELGRTLSPMEGEIISKWLEEYDEELILLALKEAIYNGTTNFRYIDRIIFEWHKKGIKTEKDIIENRKKYKNERKNLEIEDVDWLNE